LEFLKDADTRMADCYRMRGEAEMAGLGTPDPDDRCGKRYSKEADNAYKMLNRTSFEVFRSSFVSVAGDCLLPPVGGAILLGSLIWAARGFRPKNVDSSGTH
jgi:hypothetical protein